MSRKTQNELLIVENVSPVDYYNKFVVPLDKKFRPMSEGRMVGLCPFHEDTDPSLRVWKKYNIFHCFGCGVSGDVIKIHMLLRRTYYREEPTLKSVLQELANAFGIVLLPEDDISLQSVFERARNLMRGDVFKVPRTIPTYAEYAKLNKRVALSDLSLEEKIENFSMLDDVMSLHLSSKS